MSERWRQIELIFHEASKRDVAERNPYLEAACAGDQSLRKEVELLLAQPSTTLSIMDGALREEAFGLIATQAEECLSGQTLLHYEIGARIGAGGMGEVYVARDTNLGRKVALKLLPRLASGAGDGGRVLRREARTLSALNHPNIVTVYDLGRAGERSFVAMEFISGQTLRQRLSGGRLSINQAVDIAIQIASALDAAHREGIVHRDIKPENIMVRDDDVVKVLDFGIAKLLQEPGAVPGVAQPSAYQTGFAAGWGTVNYLSPEQARRESVDKRSDIFGLGVVLYEMVAGKRPFDGATTAETVDSIVNKAPAPLSDYRPNVPAELQRIITKSLSKSRDERYPSSALMLDDLLKLKESLGRDRRRQYVMESPNSPARWLFALLIAIALAAALHLLFFHPRTVWAALDVAALIVAALGALGAIAVHRKGRLRLSSVDPAFQGLSPFQEEDRRRFFGREQETGALLRMVTKQGFRFGVLYGESGSGKTSLITAGLSPALSATAFGLIVCRSYKDPLDSIIETCRKRSQLEPRDGEQPEEYIARVVRGLDGAARGLIIVCDQFEEFFVNFKKRSEREPFLSFVERCHRADNLPVRFLFCVRSDFLHHFISAFDKRIPEPLLGDKRYGLRTFEEEQAEEVIEKTAARYGLPLQHELCRLVARELAANGAVLPSELQVIGSQLQLKGIFTVADYFRAGGKDRLLHGFLEEVIKSCPERKTAEAVLAAMISDEGTRLTLSMDALVNRTRREPIVVEQVVRQLERTGLIREVQDDEAGSYELIHEYLIDGINAISGKVTNSALRANRTLRRYLASYSVDRRTRIPLTELWSIRRFSDATKGPAERELLAKSLRWGLTKAGALVLLVLLGAFGLAAAFSIREEWDAVRLSDGHTMAVRQIAMSPDGHLLVSVGEDSKVMVWDFPRRTLLATLTDHTDKVYSVAFSPDGRYFATGGQDRKAIVWSAATFEKAYVEALPGPVVSVAFSPDGRLLATASSIPDPRVVVWSVGGWSKVQECDLAGEIGAPWNLWFSPDSRWLLTPTDQSGARTLDLASGQLIEHQGVQGWNSGARALRQGGSKMITVRDGNAYFWNLSRYWSRKERRLEGSRHAQEDFARAAAFSPDGRLAATGCEDVVLWNTDTRQIVGRFPIPAIVWGLVFSTDGRYLISSHADGAILVWDVAQRKQIANLNGHSAPVRSVAFSLDGKLIASGGEDHLVTIWNAGSHRKETVLSDHNSWINGVAFSPDGRIVAGDQGGALSMSSVPGHATLWKQTGFVQYCVAVSPDNRWVASTRGVSDAIDGHLILDFSKPGTGGGEMYGVAFSKDGRRLAGVAPGSRIVSVWDTEDWRLLDSLPTGDVPLTSVSFSPDGRWLVTGDDNGAVRLWSVSPLQENAIIGRHASRIKSVAFSHDGTRIISAGDDKTIALWDFASRKLIAQIGAHTSRVLSVAFSPDDRQIVSGEEDNSVNLYTRRRTLWGHRID